MAEVSEVREWRECAFAGRVYASASKRVRRLHCDYEEGARYRRRCKWRGEVAEQICARCPVPALVEAVRAVATLDEPDFPVGYDWMFELVQAALAAIEEAK